MNINLDNIGAIIGVVSFTCAAMRIFVITPLQKSIDRLEKTLALMDEKFDTQQERLARVEESAKSAHKRIDRIEKL